MKAEILVSQKRTPLARASRSADWLFGAFVCFVCFVAGTPLHGAPAQKTFNVLSFGARGDGATLDSPAIQKAVDAAAATAPARVVVPGGHQYLVGTIELRSGVALHLERGAELLISTNQADYRQDGVIIATEARDIKISGRGRISGRAREFMTGYDQQGEIWTPAEWRPKMFILTACTNLEVRDITFGEAPQWGLHMLGCRQVLVENLTINNLLDVPNCDGIDPDHCQDVTIRGCHIRCGDDAIVVKATRQDKDYGPSARIRVSDCVLETQDSGLKIGTETTSDIHDILFQRCKINTSSRGLTIQLRDEGNVHHIDFEDITFVSRYYGDPWWGRGEAISFTAIPRTSETKLGTIHDIHLRNIRGTGENSARVHGQPESLVRNVTFEKVALMLDRWTGYQGALFDNRPTKVLEAIETHSNPCLSLRHTDGVALKNCTLGWGKHRPDYFTHAIEVENSKNLQLWKLDASAAHPTRDPAVLVR
jgi:hypothetical protein